MFQSLIKRNWWNSVFGNHKKENWSGQKSFSPAGIEPGSLLLWVSYPTYTRSGTKRVLSRKRHRASPPNSGSIRNRGCRIRFWNKIRRTSAKNFQYETFSMFFLRSENFSKWKFFKSYLFVIYSLRRIFWAIICDTFVHADDFDSSYATRPRRVWRNIETL